MGTVLYNFESKFYKTVNSLPAKSEFRHLLMIFANSYDPDQARQNSDSATETIVWKG